MLLYKWSDFLTRRQTHTKRKMHCQHIDIIRITFVAFYLYLNLNSIFSYLWKFQNKSCRVWCKFQNFLGLQFKFQWKLETKENTKFYFYFSYLWAEREYTIHSRYNGSSSKWKPEMKADAVWPTNKENTVSLLRGLHVRKNSYLPWGLHMNPQSSEKGKTIYTGYGPRKKKAQEESCREVEWEKTENYCLPLLPERPAWTLNFLSYVGVMH